MGVGLRRTNQVLGDGLIVFENIIRIIGINSSRRKALIKYSYVWLFRYICLPR